MHYVFFQKKKKLSPRTTCPQRAHIQQWCIVCRNASRALRPKRGGQNQNRWGPQVGRNATSPRGTESELDA